MSSESSSQPNIIAALEALLFVHGDPMDLKKIGAALNADAPAVAQAVRSLAERLAGNEHGLMLAVQDDRVQLVTKTAFSPFVEQLVKAEFDANLTPAALETLSLVAYLGPISRARIDHLRGVNSSYSVRNLLLRGLIEKAADPKQPHIAAYRASFDLLKHLGIASASELPEHATYQAMSRADTPEQDILPVFDPSA